MFDDMIGDMNKTIEEGQKRWEKVEYLVAQLEAHLADIGQTHSTGHLDAIHTMGSLLLLLVDHMRPMNPSKEQIDEATKGLADLLDSLKK